MSGLMKHNVAIVLLVLLAISACKGKRSPALNPRSTLAQVEAELGIDFDDQCVLLGEVRDQDGFILEWWVRCPAVIDLGSKFGEVTEMRSFESTRRVLAHRLDYLSVSRDRRPNGEIVAVTTVSVLAGGRSYDVYEIAFEDGSSYIQVQRDRN